MYFPSDMQGEQAGRCFGASIGLSYPINDGMSVDLKVGVNPCRRDGSFNQGEATFLCWQFSLHLEIYHLFQLNLNLWMLFFLLHYRVNSQLCCG